MISSKVKQISNSNRKTQPNKKMISQYSCASSVLDKTKFRIGICNNSIKFSSQSIVTTAAFISPSWNDFLFLLMNSNRLF